MTRSPWDPAQLPDQSGKTYLITGANAGLGYFSAEQLAMAGAHVILSGRNPNRLAQARAAITRRVPDSSTESILLDVSKLGSVRSAAASLRARGDIDGLLLNAGIVAPPKERTTVEGHELVLSTNVLGHFALAGELLPALIERSRTSEPVRIVWLGSISVNAYRTDVTDPDLLGGYNVATAYVQSKHIAQAIGFEADRRLRAAELDVESVVAHPGYSLTGRSPGVNGVSEPKKFKRFVDNLQAPIAQSKARGAQNQVRALIDPEVEGGDLVSPRFSLRGAPTVSTAEKPRPETTRSRNLELGARMWAMCEEATRVTWNFDKR